MTKEQGTEAEECGKAEGKGRRGKSWSSKRRLIWRKSKEQKHE